MSLERMGPQKDENLGKMSSYEQPHWSVEHLGFAMKKLQNEPPTFGEQGNTGEKDGKYRVMGYEVLKAEYDEFLERVVKLYEQIVPSKEQELDQAA